MRHQKLTDTRKSRNLSQREFSNMIAMEQTTYSWKERGKAPINDDEWIRFSKVLEVPVEDIKDEVVPISMNNKNCTFSDNSIGIQYVSIPQNMYDIVIKYNAKLEEEIVILKNKLGISS